MGSLFAGPSAAIRALGLLGKPGVFPRAMIPALAALVLSIAGVWAAVSYGPQLFAWAWPEPESWWVYPFWWIISKLVQISAGILSLLFTPWLVMLLGLPLCEPLVGRAEAVLGGRAIEGSFAGEMARTITTTVGLVLVGLAGAIGFFMLGLIPGLGVITAPFVAFIWTPMFLALDVCDSSMARRQLNLRQKIRVVLGNPVRMLSLGLTATLLVSIPILNLIGLPVAVLAGVLVVQDLLDPKAQAKT